MPTLDAATPLEVKRAAERLGFSAEEARSQMRDALYMRGRMWAERGGTPEEIAKMLACDARECGERFVSEIEINRTAAAAFRSVIDEGRIRGESSGDPALASPAKIGDGFSAMEAWLDYRAESFHFGIPELDNAMGGGVMKGQIMSIIGNPGAMKTSLALSGIERWISESKENAIFFSLDLGGSAILERLLLRELGCSMVDLKRLYRDSDSKYAEAKVHLESRYNGRLILVDNENGHWDVESLKRFVTFMTPGLVVVDYLTLLKTKGQSDYDVANEAISALKDLSRRYGIAVVALSQMSVASRREQAAGGSGGTARGGGAVDEIADAQIELYRDSAEDEEGCIKAPIVATVTKTRSGAAGSHWQLDYDGPTMNFTGGARRVRNARRDRRLFVNDSIMRA